MPPMGYEIIGTQPWTYTDETGRVVHGYRIFVRLPEYMEVHQVLSPNLTPATVRPKCEQLLKDRRELAPRAS